MSAERFSLRHLYLYAVCLITLLIAIFAVIGFVNATVELIYPDSSWLALPPEVSSPVFRDVQHRQAILGMIRNGVTLLVVVPVYLYHWRLVKREWADSKLRLGLNDEVDSKLNKK